MAVFRGKLLAAIRQAWARETLALPEGMRPQQLLNLLTRLGHPHKTPWNVHIRERYRHGAGVVTSLARYLRGGPIKNARLVACDGARVTFTCRPRQEEAAGDRPAAQLLTLSVTDFLQRWLLHIPVPQTRVVRSYGLYYPTQAEALACCRAALGSPPVEAPMVLDWQTVCAQRGDMHPERCPTCAQLLVCTESGNPQPVGAHYVRADAATGRRDAAPVRPLQPPGGGPCGRPMSHPVKEQMLAWWGPILHEFYAGTEVNGMTAITPEEWLAHKGSVGRAVVGEIHIVDEAGTEVPPGTVGLIYFAGGRRFAYHNDPAKTANAYNASGWSTIGDIGYVDQDGYLYLTDRQADMIIAGDVNIYPQEVENLLITHPKVADVAVFGVPNADLGEEVKAVVQPVEMAEAGPALAQELLSFCQQHLALFKCPRSVDFETELPRHPTGKLYKRLLKERYWVGHSTHLV
jgi:hypothetical protein